MQIQNEIVFPQIIEEDGQLWRVHGSYDPCSDVLNVTKIEGATDTSFMSPLLELAAAIGPATRVEVAL